jgi:uncharacterized protein (DUF2336 family)
MKALARRLAALLQGGPRYARAKRLAASGNRLDRLRIAGNSRAQPEILYFLAADDDAAVRSAVAGNVATPIQADAILVEDGDAEVRRGLATKLARQAPRLAAGSADRRRQQERALLERLVADEVPRVRQAIAETLKDMADAPVEIVRRLARDAEIVVAAPVLEFSPVLDEKELLTLLDEAPAAGAACAVARRRGLGPDVAAAIGRSDDVDAIAVLLANKTAQVREDTLDALIDRAGDIEAWHPPLVERPQLSPAAARRLARFVSERLIASLARRHDLDEATRAELSARVSKRLDEAVGTAGEDPSAAEARRLHEAGALDEAAIEQAIERADRSFLRIALALRSELPLGVVDAIAATHSAKAVTALAWKAGLGMPTASRVQAFLGRIPPAHRLRPLADGGYPLSPSAMTWHIEFFGGAASP